MTHSFKNLKIVRESVIETFFCESICLCKFNSSPAKNDKDRICFLTRSAKKLCLRFLTHAFVHL